MLELQAVFSGVGCLPYSWLLALKAGVNRIYTPPRKFPELLKTKVKRELKRMLEPGVSLKAEEPSEWINNMVAVHKGEKIRIYINAAQLNVAIVLRNV